MRALPTATGKVRRIGAHRCLFRPEHLKPIRPRRCIGVRFLFRREQRKPILHRSRTAACNLVQPQARPARARDGRPPAMAVRPPAKATRGSPAANLKLARSVPAGVSGAGWRVRWCVHKAEKRREARPARARDKRPPAMAVCAARHPPAMAFTLGGRGEPWGEKISCLLNRGKAPTRLQIQKSPYLLNTGAATSRYLFGYKNPYLFEYGVLKPRFGPANGVI